HRPGALLVVTFSRNEGQSSAFDADAVCTALASALPLLARNVELQRRLAAETERTAAVEQELALVYRIDEKVHDTARSHARLAHLVGQSGRFLGIAYSVLLLPAKRIRISATHS